MRNRLSKEDSDFKSTVSTDFIIELENFMEERGITQKELAKTLKVPNKYVKDIFYNPSKLTLGFMARATKALGLKFSFVVYDDGKKDNNPVFSDVFKACWEYTGRPTTGWELAEFLKKLTNEKVF